MAKTGIAVFLVSCLALAPTLALQVSPNSQCSSVCLDQIDHDKSDPMQSNTLGSDVVCRDSNYATPTGQKFKKCIECLQESADKSVSESDLQWYLYNLRFAITSCVFGLQNATDPISSPCTIGASCGPLIGSLQEGLGSPTSENRYEYCSAYGGSFLGARLWPCTRCLQLTDEQKYMGNFMVALKAACNQQPVVGKIIGLDGSLFSKNVINATDMTIAPHPAVPVESSKGGLTTGAYAGIGVAGAAVLAVLIAVCIIGKRKKQAREKRNEIASGLDGRFGSGRITVPVKGAYGDPYPSQHSPYQSVGLVTVPPQSEKGYYVPNSNESHEPYFPSAHQRPLSQVSQNANPNPDYAAPISYTTYNRSRNNSPGLSYSPADSTRPSDTPSHSPRSVADSTTHLHQPSPNEEASNLTKSRRPPVVGGMSKFGLPTRSNSNAGLADVSTFRPGRHTRDLSQARETEDRSNISGPMITVSTRFDDEDESKKKIERERLYHQGFKTHKEEVEAKSPDGEVWPGNY